MRGLSALGAVHAGLDPGVPAVVAPLSSGRAGIGLAPEPFTNAKTIDRFILGMNMTNSDEGAINVCRPDSAFPPGAISMRGEVTV